MHPHCLHQKKQPSSWQLGQLRRQHTYLPPLCTPRPSVSQLRLVARGLGPKHIGQRWLQRLVSGFETHRPSQAGQQLQHAAQQHVGSVYPADFPADGSGSPASLVGASAKQLLQTAVHSLDMFEPRESSSIEDDAGLMDSLEEVGNGAGTLATAHIVKANYEVLRLDEAGAVRRLRIKRRDLLREHGLQPRDLRRIDPSIDFTKTSPSITIKEDVLLLNLGGIRAIVTADKALLFEPASSNTRKLLDTLVPRLQASAGQRLLARQQQQAAAAAAAAAGDGPDSELYRRETFSQTWGRQAGNRAPPFELEVLEGVLMVATGRLDAEVLSVTRRVGELLQKLPRDINPVNLEELRRIKQALVELENKADTLREMLEQIMDDEDELRELNLSSRPRREERRKQRERERMERQLTRAREEMEEQARRNNNSMDDDDRRSSSSSAASTSGSTSSGNNSSGNGTSPGGSSTAIKRSNSKPPVWPGSQSPGGANTQWDPNNHNGNVSGLLHPSTPPSSPLIRPNLYIQASGITTFDRVLPGQYSPPKVQPGSSSSSRGSSSSTGRSGGLNAGGALTAAEASAAARKERIAELYAKHGLRRGPGGVIIPSPGGKDKQQRDDDMQQQQRWSSRSERDRDGVRSERDREREGDPEEDFQDAQDALEELAEQEEEEEELEEVEDLLEYYLQRASATQSEAERLLEGARDLEESIGVSLSARRYEVNRLELMLSMGSFAAALGAMIAGIFGMNMKSTLEMSVAGFWGVTIAIVVGCFYIFLMIMRYTQKKRIL